MTFNAAFSHSRALVATAAGVLALAALSLTVGVYDLSLAGLFGG